MKKLLSFLIISLILCSFFAFTASAEESNSLRDVIDPNESQPTSNATVAESNESAVLKPEENEETVDVPADSGSDCINQPNVGLIVLIAVVFCSVCMGLSALIVFANKPKDR